MSNSCSTLNTPESFHLAPMRFLGKLKELGIQNSTFVWYKPIMFNDPDLNDFWSAIYHREIYIINQVNVSVTKI